MKKDNMDEADVYLAGPGIVAVYTRSSQNDDSPNQDKIAVYPVDESSSVLIVADGAGGHANGAAASSLVIAEIKHAIDNSPGNGTELREAILTGIENANRAIGDKINGAASTVAVVEIRDNRVRTYHAGDTEVMVTGQRGKIKHQTLIHSPVGYAVEAGLLEEEKAIMHEERHVVSNVLGFSDMHTTISTPLRLCKYDTLLVGTDGLFDNLQKTEIIEIIRKGSITASSNKLINSVYQRMHNPSLDQPSKLDDVSFVLFRLN